MGHGDETEFIYIFESEKVSSLLEHLTSSLDHSEYQIDNAEIDRSAFIDFQDKTFELPIYAISMNHFSSHDDGEDDSCDDKESNAFRPEKDLRKALKPKGKRIEFESGVWCNPKSLLDEDQAERTARIGRKRFRLTHIRIQLELGAKYAKLTLNIWGGVYWGGVHSDPSFKNLRKHSRTSAKLGSLRTNSLQLVRSRPFRMRKNSSPATATRTTSMTKR